MNNINILLKSLKYQKNAPYLLFMQPERVCKDINKHPAPKYLIFLNQHCILHTILNDFYHFSKQKEL
jgi:hypothetical protein